MQPTRFHNVRTDDLVDAFKITQDNWHAVARWCGGRVVNKHDEGYLVLEFAGISALQDEYVYQVVNRGTLGVVPAGVFSAMSPELFEETHHVVGEGNCRCR